MSDSQNPIKREYQGPGEVTETAGRIVLNGGVTAIVGAVIGGIAGAIAYSSDRWAGLKNGALRWGAPIGAGLGAGYSLLFGGGKAKEGEEQVKQLVGALETQGGMLRQAAAYVEKLEAEKKQAQLPATAKGPGH